MQYVFQVCAYLLGVPLELMVIAALLRGEYRRYPFVFLYAVVDLLTTILEIQPSMAYRTGIAEARHRWATCSGSTNESCRCWSSLLVISLVYSATKHLRPRRTML